MSDELAELKVRYERLKILQEISQVIHSTLDPQQALHLILQQAVKFMRASSGSLVLINPTTSFLEIHASMGLPDIASGLKLRVGEGITGWVAMKGLPARSGDVSRDPRYVKARENVNSELAVPLTVNGQIRGVINVDSDRQNAFSEADQELLESLALSAARVIQNTWQYEQLRLKSRLFEGLASVGRTINSAINLDDALRVITVEAARIVKAKMCSLLLLDETREWLELKANFGAGEAYLTKPRLSVADSLLGTVVRRRKPVQVENVQTSSRYQRTEVARLEGLVSLLSVPLLFGGKAIGTLNVYMGQTYKFSDEEVRMLFALAELSAITLEKARLYERVVDVEEQLRQNEKLSAIGLLAAEVAHEIRNPLTVMKMLYHSLDLKFPRQDPRNEDARIIGEKMEHLNKIVEQILDFARTSEPHLSSVDVNEVIEELGLLVRHKLRNQNIQLVQNLASDLPAIMADSTHLEQAFLNLILNATEAMPKGGKLTLTSRVVKLPPKSPGMTHLAVEFGDTGVGMAPAQQRKAFISVLNTTKPRGTGIGLAIVGRVVENHRGKIKIKSSPGRGTTITILLPL